MEAWSSDEREKEKTLELSSVCSDTPRRAPGGV